MKTKILYIITFLSLNTFGQSDTLRIDKRHSSGELLDSLQVQRSISDQLDEQLIDYLETGKFDINISTLKDQKDHYTVTTEPRLTLHQRVNVNSNKFSDSLLLFHDALTIANEHLFELQNSGFPFAEYQTQAELKNDSLLLKFALNKGPLIILDSIFFLQRDIIKTPYIYNYLNYKLGTPYSEDYILNIEKALRNSEMIELANSPSVIFIQDKAQLILDLKKPKSSRFDGIIGIQPNADGKTSITGLVNLNLKNTLKRAETIYINWERLKDQNQILKAGIEVPYLFKSKAGLSFNSNIIRQDSSLNRLTLSYGLNYHFTPFTKADLSVVSIKNNSNLSATEAVVESQINSYQASFLHQKIDYLLNPQKGINTTLQLFTGTRTSNDLKSNTLGVKGKLEKYIPILKHSTIKLFGIGESIISDSLNANELFLTGGLNSIRGVDQRAILASSWLTSGAEYRFLFDKNSSILLFGEIHFNETKSTSSYSKDTIKATGIGLNVGNNNGIFSFSYGLSDFGGENFLLKNGKINFGYTSTF